MSHLPQRPRTHIQQKESRLFIERLLPAEWKVNVEAKDSESSDYGLDLIVEIIEKSDVTGAHFAVQLKSTDNLKVNKKGIISHSCKTSTLQYFLERPELVIYLIYDTVNDIGYWIWIQDFLRNQPNSNWKKKKSFTIKIPKSNILEKNSIDKIKKRVLRFHDKEKLINAIQTINHPGIRYGLEVTDNITSVNAYYKYPGAEIDYPLNFGLTLNFDNSEEGESARKSWENAFKKGLPAKIDGRFIKEFTTPDELAVINSLFGESFKPDGLMVQPLSRENKFMARFDIYSKTNKLVAQIPFVELKETRYGTEEAHFSNEHQSIPAKFSLILNLVDKAINIKFKLYYEGFNILQVKDVLNFQLALAKGGSLQIVQQDTGITLLKKEFPEALVSAPLDIHLEIIDDLAIVQKLTKTLFTWPQKITWDDYDKLKKAVEIISKGETYGGNIIDFKISKSSAIDLSNAFIKNPKLNLVFNGPEEILNIFERTINFGQTRLLVFGASPTKETQDNFEFLNNLNDDSDFDVQLIAEDPGIIIQYLNWLPKNKGENNA